LTEGKVSSKEQYTTNIKLYGPYEYIISRVESTRFNELLAKYKADIELFEIKDLYMYNIAYFIRAFLWVEQNRDPNQTDYSELNYFTLLRYYILIKDKLRK